LLACSDPHGPDLAATGEEKLVNGVVTFDLFAP
jgi:hypothetical protein